MDYGTNDVIESNLDLDVNSSDDVDSRRMKKIAWFGGSFCKKKGFSNTKKYLEKSLNVSIDNYAVSGAGFSEMTQKENIQAEVDSALKKTTNYDVFIFWASSNDFLKVGQFLYSSDIGVVSQNEGIEYCFKAIKQKFPKAQILFFTSIPVFHLGEVGYSLSGDLENSFRDFVDAQKEICRRYKVPYLDQFAMGLVNEFNYKDYTLGDFRHLNESGYELYKKIQAHFISRNVSGIDYSDESTMTFRERFISIFPVNQFKLQAHRGFSGMYPENTELAFEKAAEIANFKGIETDTRSLVDGSLMCFHNAFLDQTTTCEGKISDYTREHLDTCYIKKGNGWKDSLDKRLKIPTLEDYLKICKRYGKTPYVDLKSQGKKNVVQVISVIRENGFEDGSFVLISFDEKTLAYAAEICDTPLEILKESFDDSDVARLSSIRNIVFRPRSKNVTKEFVSKILSMGFLVETWDIPKQKEQVQLLKSWGVEGGTCNYSIEI